MAGHFFFFFLLFQNEKPPPPPKIKNLFLSYGQIDFHKKISDVVGRRRFGLLGRLANPLEECSRVE